MAATSLPQICMEPRASVPTETPIAQLQALVGIVEAARLQSRPLTAEEDAKIDGARDAKAPLVAIAAMQAGEDRSEIGSLGHRLWAALGHAATDMQQDAKCRTLACELYAAGMGSGPSASKDTLLLATHWALAGYTWVCASDDQKALACFAEAMKPVRANAQRCDAKLAELAAQTLLWMADARFRQATYKEAFADLANVRELLSLHPELQQAQLRPQKSGYTFVRFSEASCPTAC